MSQSVRQRDTGSADVCANVGFLKSSLEKSEISYVIVHKRHCSKTRENPVPVRKQGTAWTPMSALGQRPANDSSWRDSENRPQPGPKAPCPRAHNRPSILSRRKTVSTLASALPVCIQADTCPQLTPGKLHTIKSERWSDPELKPLVSESEGLLERESRMGRVSRRELLTEGAGNLSTTSAPRGSSGRKLKGDFPRTLPSGLWSMLSTREKKKVS